MFYITHTLRLALAVAFAALACVASRAQTAALSDSIVDQLRQINLPLMNITTVEGKLPKSTYVSPPDGCVGKSIVRKSTVTGRLVMTLGDSLLYDSGTFQPDSTGITLHMRGNTSSYNLTPSYKLKLQQRADLLQRGERIYRNKHWALLNQVTTRDFKTMVGQQVAMLCGTRWEPANRFVNLVIDGSYRGVYLLIETVKESEGRCNVPLEGYVTECDSYWWTKNDSNFHSNNLPYTMGYTFKYPDADEIDAVSFAYIRNTINNFEDALYGGQPIDDLFDTRSLMGWFLAHDILGTWDGCGSNMFLIKDDRRDSRLRMGPLWDFDSIFKRSGEWASVHHIQQFYGAACFSRPELVQEYVDLWREVRPLLQERVKAVVDSLCTNYGEAVDSSRVLAARWGALPTIADNAKAVEDWFAERIPWLDEHIENLLVVQSDSSMTAAPMGAVQRMKVYAADGRLCFEGTPDACAKWVRAAQTSVPGAYILRSIGRNGEVLRTEEVMKR